MQSESEQSRYQWVGDVFSDVERKITLYLSENIFVEFFYIPKDD